MKIIEDEVIGELRYLTVEFDQTELMDGMKHVISQGAVRRYFEGKNPDLKVKKCGGLKLDSQRDIVTMRIGVVKGPVTATVLDEVSVVDPMTIAPAIDQKLLNPGYDELMGSHAELEAQNRGLRSRIDELTVSRDHIIDEMAETEKQLLVLQEKYEKVKREEDTVRKLFDNVRNELDVLKDNYDRTKNRYDLLISEFDELKEKYDALVDARKEFEVCPHCVENEELKKEVNKTGLALLDAVKEVDKLKEELEVENKLCRCGKCADDLIEDSADLAEAEEVLAEDDFVDGPFSTSAPTAEEVAKEGIKIIAAEQGIDCNPDDCENCKSPHNVEMTGADGSKIEGEKAEDGVRGDRSNEITVADSDEENKNE